MEICHINLCLICSRHNHVVPGCCVRILPVSWVSPITIPLRSSRVLLQWHQRSCPHRTTESIPTPTSVHLIATWPMGAVAIFYGWGDGKIEVWSRCAAPYPWPSRIPHRVLSQHGHNINTTARAIPDSADFSNPNSRHASWVMHTPSV